MSGGGGNVRALEYRTESGTYYTTSAGSAGLTDITALTRSSTSGESYLTSGVGSSCFFKYSTQLQNTLYNTDYPYNAINNNMTYFVQASLPGDIRHGNNASTASILIGSSTVYTFMPANGTMTTGQTNRYQTQSTIYSNTIQVYRQIQFPMYNSTYDQAGFKNEELNTFFGWFPQNMTNPKIIQSETSMLITKSSSTSGTFLVYNGRTEKTTARSYRTLQFVNQKAKIITTGTSYLTCSSTSAYSGKSSSSTSGWY